MQLIAQAGDLGPKWFHIALRALSYMGQAADLTQSAKLAEVLGEDATYVRKILSRLARAGLVTAQGGRYGGYKLEKPPCEITVLSVYKAFDNTPHAKPDAVAQTGTERFISLLISKAENEFQSILSEYTIKDIIDNKMD